MSLLSSTHTVSRIVLNTAASVGFLFMSYFWYHSALSARESRLERRQQQEQLNRMIEQNCCDSGESSESESRGRSPSRRHNPNLSVKI